MTNNLRWSPSGWLMLLGVLVFQGCAGQPVRHLASDASLVVPGSSTRQEVQQLLGPPDQQEGNVEQGEIWQYRQVNKSLLRKAPYVGNALGNQNYDVLTITFQNDIVKASVFRNFDDEKLSGLEIDVPNEIGRDQ